MTYRTVDVGVRGGPLRVGVWESADLSPHSGAGRTVLGIHGITSSHLVWTLVAQRMVKMPGIRLIAPDLRGRGRSADLPGPWGLRAHAEDLAAVTAEFGRPDVTVGHSMGGFVAVVAAQRRPALFGQLLLVDGGVPLPLPTDEPVDVLIPRLLGPTADRLAMRFPDHEAYRRWWRAHPAFAGGWSVGMDAYIDYDLVPDGDGATRGWRSVSRMEAVAQDFPEQGDLPERGGVPERGGSPARAGGGVLQAAWTGLTSQPDREVLLLRAPLGLLAEPPGLYAVERLDRFAATHPGFRWSEVPNTNHYTVLLGDVGAARVAAELTDLLGVAAAS